jgi:transposase, IS5 family
MINLRHPQAVPANRMPWQEIEACRCKRLVTQIGSRKAVGNRAKRYNWHESEVECMFKGKSRNPCGFGVKVGLSMTLKGHLIVLA